MFKLDKSNRALLNKACLTCLEQKMSFEERCKPDMRPLAGCTSWAWSVGMGICVLTTESVIFSLHDFSMYKMKAERLLGSS